ncbi:PREDICTED: beta-glucuronosyltransferase GlcAT14A-like [Ipomoea nil]|uniref:beta-glucuronosyltransferase GlcAT14A-like n=1 Tax=Ipomoea nil TaxID=35883 RepID=UPI0009017C3B|nr:PREDICTED: beta-glucuronosyltransferase GlcAT14A-like [Ipomoea nil]
MQKRIVVSKAIIFSWVSRYRRWLLSIAGGALMMILALGTGNWSNLDHYTAGKGGTNLEFPMSEVAVSKGPSFPPVLAYWILGSKGDSKRMLRLLRAVYHPRNQYLLQLDSDSSDQERLDLVLSVEEEKVFRAFGNVYVVGKSYAVNQMGASGLAAMLHAAALLLRLSRDWDWFINLSSSDYPLLTQDDILYAFTCLPRDVNFLGFKNITEFNGQYDFNQIAVDPNLYSTENTPIFYAREGRGSPDAFKIFGGSPWTTLSRGFMEHCVEGWDNLPRKLLLYYTNVVSPLESYFHTLVCNTPEFQNSTVNRDLRLHTVKGALNLLQRDEFTSDLAVFARTFEKDDEAMEGLDRNVLNRAPDGLVPGKWCLPRSTNESVKSGGGEGKVCSSWGDINSVQPGSYGVKLHKILSKFSAEKESQTNLCRMYTV